TGSGPLAGDKQVHRAQFCSRAHGGQCRVLEGAVLVFGPNQRGHATTPNVFSLETSSSTESTFTPACRTGGSATFSTFRRGVMSTPYSAALFTTSGFDLAFMMLGSDA